MNLSKVLENSAGMCHARAGELFGLGGFEVRYLFVGDRQVSHMKVALCTFPRQCGGGAPLSPFFCFFFFQKK